MDSDASRAVRSIAFFLPQFHPIEENDQWWGPGFTEWRKVVQARPLYPGHHQPDLPADLGFYDLRLKETRDAQWSLASRHGIDGFCYYHYWFGGDRLLEKPTEQLIADPTDTTQFMLCWANENWTRNWDGGERKLLKQQRYSREDDVAHFRYLLPYFCDERYIKHEGKPVFVVYRPASHPDIGYLSSIWNRMAREAGLPGLHLCAVEDPYGSRADPQSYAFDAAVEFAPDPKYLPARMKARLWRRAAGRVLPQLNVHRNHSLYEYADVVSNSLARKLPDHPVYRCVTPSWDNTPRRPTGGRVLVGATAEQYESWLSNIHRQSRISKSPFVFINAWNEWAEGAHLEPDLRRGTALLQATRRALQAAQGD